MASVENTGIGKADKHFVTVNLERKGFICALPIPNARRFDLIAINPETLEQLAIQVKTTEKSCEDWLLNEKKDNYYADNLFYAFAALGGLGQPEYHIIPSETVAKRIAANCKAWITAPGRNGQARSPNPKSHFHDDENESLSKWDHLAIHRKT